VTIAPTPRDTLLRDGTASLYRFRRPPGSAEAVTAGAPLLIVPSLINRWYVVDLHDRATLVGALVNAGIDVWCLDWGVPEDEDRYLGWDDVLARLRRAARAVRRTTGAGRIGLLGYCMGGTLSGVHAALHPDEIAALVNLAGPFDFSQAGLLGEMVRPAWFDVEAIAGMGNVSPHQMQSGFVALRPTAQIAKWVALADRWLDPVWRQGYQALETWASDNIAFPAAAYVTYIRELYQENRLVRGEHRVDGRLVDLGRIGSPVLTIVAEDDRICPPAAAVALNERSSARDREVLSVPGGHVSAVVGSRATNKLYPAIARWLIARGIGPASAQPHTAEVHRPN
jgi:polyhydroxyalkanoate synthase